MTGLLRLKRRTALRPSLKPLSRIDFLLQRQRELRSYALSALQLLLEMQLFWLETRRRSPAEERVIEELRRLKNEHLVRVKLGELYAAYVRAKESLPQLHVPGRFRLFAKKWSPLSLPAPLYSSRDVLDFRHHTLDRLVRGRLWELAYLKLIHRLWLELRLSIHFAAAWLRHAPAGRGPWEGTTL